MRYLRPLLGLVVATSLIWWLVRGLDRTRFVEALGGVSPGWLLAGVLSLACGYACRITRWRALLSAAGARASWMDCSGPFLASYALNNVLPLRAGDALRATAFHGELGLGTAALAATLVVERLLDLGVISGLLAVALAYVSNDPAHATWRLITIGLAGGAALAVLVACIIGPSLADRLAGSRFAALAPFASGLAALRHPRLRWTCLGLSLLAWIGEAGTAWCGLRALGMDPTAGMAAVAIGAGTLATLLPGPPGHVGTFHTGFGLGLVAAGVAREPGLAAAIIVHAMLWLPITATGGAWLLLSRRRPHTESNHA